MATTATTKVVRLTREEKRLLALIRNGADVTGYDIAKGLRALDAKYPGLMDICEPMGRYAVTDKLPYFGAIVSARGKRLLTGR